MTAKAWRRVVFLAIIWWVVCNQGFFEAERLFPFTQRVTVDVENTKPTNNVIFVHLKPGIVCSGDADLPFIKALQQADGQPLQVTLAYPRPLEEIRR